MKASHSIRSQKRYLFVVTLAFCTVFYCFNAFATVADEYLSGNEFLIKDVTVIDGLGNKEKPHQDIFISNGKIVSILPSGQEQAINTTTVIDGKGLTAMPGLIDSHIHIRSEWHGGVVLSDKYPQNNTFNQLQQTYAAYLYAGVTTVFDVGDPTDFAVGEREKMKRGEYIAPRMFTTGMPFSQHPSGWDSATLAEYPGKTMEDIKHLLSVKIDTDDLEALGKKLDAYVENDIEIIKVYRGASAHATGILMQAAKKRNIRAVADLWQMNMDRPFLQVTGVNGWAHATPFGASEADMKWMAENDRFMIATAVLGEVMSGLRFKEDKEQRFFEDPLVVDIWGKDVVKDFYETYPEVREVMYDGPSAFYQLNNFGDMEPFRERFLENIKMAHDMGVLVAGGSDSPAYPALWAGESMHRELELMVMAGLSPLDAIKVCTYNGAKVLQREKVFGSLQAGLSADILLVKGNPWVNISDSRNIQYTFLRGQLLDRKNLLTSWK